MRQHSLFPEGEDPAEALPPGAIYQPAFLTDEEEAGLIALLASLPLAPALYKAYTARRKVLSFGGTFDYDRNVLAPAPPLIEALHPLRDKVAAWAGTQPQALAHVLLAAYEPGTPLGWHRDVPEFEDVFGVSLGAPAVMRWRPYPPVAPKRSEIVRLELAPRSVYALRGAARWQWQHSIAPVTGMRWSITFRTRRQDLRRRPPVPG